MRLALLILLALYFVFVATSQPERHFILKTCALAAHAHEGTDGAGNSESPIRTTRASDGLWLFVRPAGFMVWALMVGL
jgi:hypothetical protein